MTRVHLTPGFEVSRIIHGLWRLPDWQMKDRELMDFLYQVIDLGITTFDHADIYGDYECEQLFGRALKPQSHIRKDIQLVTKCGIKLLSEKFPDRKVKTYDYSFEHITTSVESSLRSLHTDYIDLLLLHRPSPLFDPAEVARAFFELEKSGKVLHFGVSNFSPQQFEMLQSYVDQPLLTNQVEISPLHLNVFEDGNIESFFKHKIHPMAWSPLAGGQIFNPTNQHEVAVHQTLSTIGEEIGAEGVDQVVYSWLLKHPAGILPVVGSGKIERLQTAVQAGSLKMTDEQWYRIFIASKGEELP